MSLIVDGTTGVTFNDSSLQGAAASPYVLKNRIINGDMRIDQRNAGASYTQPVNQGYGIDRWYSIGGVTSKFTMQQNAGSVTPPSGFKNYLGMTSLSSYSIGAGDSYTVSQSIEGFNTADLGYGASGASTVTLSFWARSSLTGTFGGSLANANALNSPTRSYPFSYTISAANTWTFVSVTIPGDTSGTWTGSTNGTGLVVNFSIGVGTNYQGTAGAWVTGNKLSVTGEQQVVANNASTLYLTGVQLEIGSTATPFERRLYNQELANCQRYYIKLNTYGVLLCIPSTNRNDRWSVVTLPVPMRSSPTLTLTADSSVAASTADNITITISVDALNTTTAKSWTTLVSSAEL